MRNHSVYPQEIVLERYYPPTPSKFTKAQQDIGFLASQQDLEFAVEGLDKVARVCETASNFDSLGLDDHSTYTDIAARARALAGEKSMKAALHTFEQS